MEKNADALVANKSIPPDLLLYNFTDQNPGTESTKTFAYSFRGEYKEGSEIDKKVAFFLLLQLIIFFSSFSNIYTIRRRDGEIFPDL